MRAILPGLVFLFIVACGDERRAPAPPAASTPSAADSTQWLTRQRLLDFTGDGIEDTVRLEATGPTVDSLRIVLEFVSGGVTRWGVEWASEYELTIPAAPTDSAARAEHLRKRLDRVMASVQVEPFDRTSYMTMAQEVDSAVLRDPPARQVRFAYGYETTVVLAWDQVAGVLRVLHSCC